MYIVVQIMIFLLIGFPLSVLVCVGLFPKKYYTVQKAILKRMIPESPEDIAKLVINGTVAWISIWSVLALLVSLVEKNF